MKITELYRIINCTPVWLELSMSQVWKPSGALRCAIAHRPSNEAQLDGRCGISAIEFDVVVLCQCLGSWARWIDKPSRQSPRGGSAARSFESRDGLHVPRPGFQVISGDFRGCLYCLTILTTPTKKDEKMVKPLNHVEPFEALSC